MQRRRPNGWRHCSSSHFSCLRKPKGKSSSIKHSNQPAGPKLQDARLVLMYVIADFLNVTEDSLAASTVTDTTHVCWSATVTSAVA